MNDRKFEAMWAGDTTGYASHSEADQALIGLLGFYTQDEEQLDSFFRRSGLCRDKWSERRDYRRRTIERALSNLTETYAPSDDGARMVVGNGRASLPSPFLSLSSEPYACCPTVGTSPVLMYFLKVR
jgi:putative DNA primase/helicase